MSQQQTVNVADLDIAQLSEVRKQLEDVGVDKFWPFFGAIADKCLQELNHLTNSFAQLKQAQAKFKACLENVAEVKPANKGACPDWP